MNKKYLIVLLTTILTTACFSQVGIGTVAPVEDLHVAGSTASIRIESLNSTNNATYNDGINLAPAYVDGNGDITLGNGTGVGGVPLNFLIDVPNFVPDDPYGLGLATGTVVNNDNVSETVTVGQITTVAFNVPQDAIVEIKYGITMIVVGNDLSLGCPCVYVDFDQAVALQTFLKVDIDSDGLSGSELTKIYGQKAQYYATDNQGIVGYPYMNGQAYLTLPAGNHTLYFYGQVSDDALSYTSVGFGGAQDYLKIRVYN